MIKHLKLIFCKNKFGANDKKATFALPTMNNRDVA